MGNSMGSAITIVIGRAAIVVLGGIAICAFALGAIGFALIALYTFLLPSMGPAAAALATSGVALAIPIAVVVTTLVVMRGWTMGGFATAPARASIPSPSLRSTHEPESVRIESTLGWIAEHPRTATLGALTLGVALGAYPDLRKTILNGVDSTLSQDRVSAA